MSSKDIRSFFKIRIEKIVGHATRLEGKVEGNAKNFSLKKGKKTNRLQLISNFQLFSTIVSKKKKGGEEEKSCFSSWRDTFLFPYFPTYSFSSRKRNRDQLSRHVLKRRDFNTHLLAPHVPVPDPLAELRPPILEHIRLRVFDTLAVAKAALSARGGDHVDRVKIDFQPLAWLCGDLQLRAPGTSVALLLQPVNGKYLH